MASRGSNHTTLPEPSNIAHQNIHTLSYYDGRYMCLCVGNTLIILFNPIEIIDYPLLLFTLYK